MVCLLSFSLGPAPGTREFDWLREAEKKHARVAMIAAPSLATIALATGDDPVPWLNQQPAMTQLLFYSTAGLLESLNLRRFDPGFKLRVGETPGRLLDTAPNRTNLDVLEDNVGRLAMLGVTSNLLSSLLN